jgi:hypothetical protein
MRILAIDLGKRMGIADGAETDFALNKRPRVEAVTLKGTSAEARTRWFGNWIRERLYITGRYDLIVTESPMNPVVSKSADATIAQLYLHGALLAVAAVADVEVVHAPVMTVRKHFVGQATASHVHWKGHKRTVAEARVARTEINDMVLRRAILLGYLPEGSSDWDCANAAALWDFACAKYARALPKELVMFGARA